MTTAEQLLNQLAEIQAQTDLLLIRERELKEEAMGPQIVKEIREIEEEFSAARASAEKAGEDLKEAIRREVSKEGVSVKGDRLQAVFVKGRVTWDAKALDGYAINNPALFAFRKESEPTVQIRQR